MDSLRCTPLGDTAIHVGFNQEVSPILNKQIMNFCAWLQKQSIPGVIEWVPSYDSVTIYYRPEKLSYQQLSSHVGSYSPENIEIASNSHLVEVPVLYDGMDLGRVAELNHITVEKVIELHTQPEYLIYMIGFLPGFPYVGGLPDELSTPRLENPRSSVPAGSVGIAGSQTGIYPLESPGGWNIIGRTPLRLFDPERKEPILFQAGDYIRFTPITMEEYQTIEVKIQNNQYEVKKEVR